MSLGSDPMRLKPRTERLTQWLFVFFLLLIFVGFEPFRPRDLAYMRSELSGEGDIRRQIGYVFIFASILLTYVQNRGIGRILSLVPVFLWLGLAWISLSALWSVDSELTVRRAGLTVIISLCIFMIVDLIRIDRTIEAIKWVLAAVIVIDLVSLPFVPQAIHTATEIDPGLVGAWRGMHIIKNIAGVIAAYAVFVFLYAFLTRKRAFDAFSLIASIVFFVGTNAKAAAILLPLSIVVLILYRIALSSRYLRALVIVILSFSVISVLVLGTYFSNEVIEFLNEPGSLTGRAGIWHVVWTYLFGDWTHWLLGAGYGAFWEGGGYASVAGRNAATYLTHSHNGILEMWVETGVVGVAIALILCIYTPIRQILTFSIPMDRLIVPWMMFSMLINGTESNFFARDKVVWVMFLIALAMLRQGRASSRPTPPTPAR